MSIWPWRSRPVVTPFTGDYSGRVLTFPGIHSVWTFAVSVPDNLYIMPSSIVIPYDCGAGIRNTTPSYTLFSRGNTVYAGAIFGNVLDNHDGHFCLADCGDDFSPVGAVVVRMFQLPKPLFLYPADCISFYIPSLIAADTVGPVTIHGKFWEVH